MWIHVPSTSLASAPAAGGSTSDSAWRAQLLASSAALNGKPTAMKTWLRAWKSKSWMRRLFGRISRPSTASPGVALWISSLRECLASPGQSPASALGRQMNATYGPTLLASLARLNPNSCSSKTCRESLFGADSTAWPATCAAWVIGLRRDCSARQRRARELFGGDCSFWPSPVARDYKGADSYRDPAHGQSLPKFCQDLGRLDLARSARFRECLMGWPERWTAGPSECESRAKAFTLYRQRMRSYLSTLLSRMTGEP